MQTCRITETLLYNLKFCAEFQPVQFLAALAALYLPCKFSHSFMVLNSASQFRPNHTRPYQTMPRTILSTMPHTILLTIPQTIQSTMPHTILSTMPHMILSTMPHMILSTMPLNFLNCRTGNGIIWTHMQKIQKIQTIEIRTYRPFLQ